MPRRSARAWPLLALLLLAACARRAPETVPAPPEPAPPRPVKVGLALGSGGSRGFAHVGVIRALSEGGIPVDLIAGTSVGSLIGALYADRPDVFELEAAAWQIDEDDLFDWSLLGGRWGLVTGKSLEAFVREHVRAPAIEGLGIPFLALATDLDTGEPVVLDRGPVAPAVRASSAIPGIFRPVRIDGRLLVDGGVVEPVPVSALRARGAEVVIAVDISGGLPDQPPEDLADITLRSLTILMGALAAERASAADVVIHPVLGTTSPFDFTRKKEMMGAGLASGREALPRIREAIARVRARSGRTRPPAPGGAPAPAADARPPG